MKISVEWSEGITPAIWSLNFDPANEDEARFVFEHLTAEFDQALVDFVVRTDTSDVYGTLLIGGGKMSRLAELVFAEQEHVANQKIGLDVISDISEREVRKMVDPVIDRLSQFTPLGWYAAIKNPNRKWWQFWKPKMKTVWGELKGAPHEPANLPDQFAGEDSYNINYIVGKVIVAINDKPCEPFIITVVSYEENGLITIEGLYVDGAIPIQMMHYTDKSQIPRFTIK
jgi:hypothetical protein